MAVRKDERQLLVAAPFQVHRDERGVDVEARGPLSEERRRRDWDNFADDEPDLVGKAARAGEYNCGFLVAVTAHVLEYVASQRLEISVGENQCADHPCTSAKRR